jgi:hypothetical protein
MNPCSDTPQIDWPDTTAMVYRSEAFAEDLEGLDLPPAPGWHPLERLVATLPLLCVFMPVVDAYLLH